MRRLKKQMRKLREKGEGVILASLFALGGLIGCYTPIFLLLGFVFRVRPF